MNLLAYRLTLMTGIALLAGGGTLHARAYGVSRTTAVARGPNGNVAVASRTTVAGGGGYGAARRTTVVAGGNGNVAVAHRTAVVRPLPHGYIRVVPAGYRTVYYGGYNCYFVSGVYYRAVFYEGETVYVVVN